ncbi:MAG: DUF1549 domain-containing protein [Planctomycetaceae bacterium]|nr:DUF1549 domain-containing protein [Planctomycetaceae bacterium]
MRYSGLIIVLLALVADAQEPLRAPRPITEPQAPKLQYRTVTAEEVDELIAVAVERNVADFKAASDPVFLRRVTLDLLGRQPTLEEQNVFLNDDSTGKRQRLIERCLAHPDFGKNWANYWSDTISYRVTPPELTFLNYEPLKEWLAEQFNQNVAWDEVVTEILTSTGKVSEEPAATFVAYHQGEPTKLAAETARIFLGVQIQCAECHDHPFDDWKRDQFHSLAAYFARTQVKMPHNKGAATVVSAKEKGEYKMPNADPGKKGQEMQPVFLSGQQMDAGRPDHERRAELAQLLTDNRNRWFARAFVNRLWDRIAGDGFYSPVDNMGVNQPQLLPEVHESLTDHFLATGYDVKDLFQLILNTRYYGQEIPTDLPERTHPFAYLEQTRLRGDEVFDSLQTALDVPVVRKPTPKPTAEIRFPPPPKTIQESVAETFGYDPSFGPQVVQRTMSQAMLMMNNEELQAQVDADPESGTVLAKLLQSETDDAQVITKLYRLLLARKPTDRELKICWQHVQSIEDRGAAFEDVLWSLINSTEFTTRR